MVITSCDRFDLLEATLESMAPWLDEFPNKVIVEDSDKNPILFDRLRAEGFKIVVNGRRLGQMASIDVAYALCRTEFIFHCEDDWRFRRKPNVEAACHILRHGLDDGPVSVVCFRDTTGTKHAKRGVFEDRVLYGSVFRYSFEHQYDFNYFSLNPGMLRRDLYQRYGPWQRYANERAIARMMRGERRCIVREVPGNVVHIGRGRSRVRSRRWSWFKDAVRDWFSRCRLR